MPECLIDPIIKTMKSSRTHIVYGFHTVESNFVTIDYEGKLKLHTHTWLMSGHVFVSISTYYRNPYDKINFKTGIKNDSKSNKKISLCTLGQVGETVFVKLSNECSEMWSFGWILVRLRIFPPLHVGFPLVPSEPKVDYSTNEFTAFSQNDPF